MKTKTLFGLSFAVVLGLSVFAFSTQAGNPSRYFVQNAGFARALVAVQHNFDNGFTTELTSGQVRAIELLGGTVEPVALFHTTDKPSGKPGKGGGGGDVPSRLATPSDQTPWGIEKMYNNPAATSTAGGLGVAVAVLDTGVMTNHIDLSRRVAQCKDFTGRGIKNRCQDGNGHGTHVAGTILADGGSDGLGIWGMAPEANLFAYKVCGNSGFCWADDIASAIRHAADEGANIISMSLGADAESPLIRDAISYATAGGSLVVAAAGNDGPDDGSIDYPGANASVIAIGAIDSSEQVPSWSSRGVNDGDYIVEEREVEFAAPGVLIESTWNDGAYNTISGTSMATPHIAGLAAKLWQGSASATRDYLHTIARDIWTAGDDTATGFGLPTVQ